MSTTLQTLPCALPRAAPRIRSSLHLPPALRSLAPAPPARRWPGQSHARGACRMPNAATGTAAVAANPQQGFRALLLYSTKGPEELALIRSIQGAQRLAAGRVAVSLRLTGGAEAAAAPAAAAAAVAVHADSSIGSATRAAASDSARSGGGVGGGGSGLGSGGSLRSSVRLAWEDEAAAAARAAAGAAAGRVGRAELAEALLRLRGGQRNFLQVSGAAPLATVQPQPLLESLSSATSASDAAAVPPAAAGGPDGDVDGAGGDAAGGAEGGSVAACGRPITAFICGPPAMTDAVEAHLLALGLPKECVRVERWW